MASLLGSLVGSLLGSARGSGSGIGGTVAATLSSGSLDLLTDGTEWAATLTWSTPGIGGNGKRLSLRFDVGAPAVEVRDNSSNTTGNAWLSDIGTVGVHVTGDVGLPVTIADLEAAINASSALVQVTTPDPSPLKEIDMSTLDTAELIGSFTGGY